ncbi:MAG: thioredoxin domain-containing protein, partial [Thiobacillus sp.]
FNAHLLQQPIAYPTLLAVLDEALVPPRAILLRGPAADLREWTAALGSKLAARDLLLSLPNGLRLPSALEKPESTRPVAWICSGTACQLPVAELARLID